MSIVTPNPPTGPGDGVPNLTLPGSGLYVPAGIDAVLEFNGLLMNVMKNADRYRVTNIDGLYDADVRDARDSAVDDDGEVPYKSYYGGRTLAISGTIETYSVGKMWDMRKALMYAFNDISQEQPLYFRMGNVDRDHFMNVKKIGPIAGIEQQTNLQARRDFQITVRASNPRFLSVRQNFLDQSFGSTVGSPTLLGIAHNRGTYKAQPIFRVYGPSTNGATIANTTTGQSFSLGPIPVSDYYEFDLTRPSKTLLNSHGQNMWMWLNDDSDYIDLIGGMSGADNALTYMGDASRVTVTWHDSWK